MTISTDRVVDALSRIDRLGDSGSNTPKGPPLTIAITREAGSRGAEIAKSIGARLEWPVYDSELLKRIAEEKGLNAKLLAHLDERCSTWIEDLINGLSPHTTITEEHYIKHLLQLIASLGSVGHCVIVGRGAAHVLPPDTTLRVRIVASRITRVSHVQKERGISITEAERWVDRTDAIRTHFVKTHFHVNPSDPILYDLIVNSGRYTIEQSTELIVQAAKMMEAKKPTS